MSGQDVVRAGVIGVGIMGERHARLYSQLPSAQLVGVYDPDLTRALAVAARWDTRAFTSVERLLREVDAVSIASSTPTHASLASAALDRGVHLLVEKPLADNLDDARLLAARAARRPALRVQVGHIERFNPVVRELQRLLRGEHLQAVTMQRLSPFDGRCLDSDIVHDLMIHDLDLARAFCGDGLELIAASGGRVYSPSTDQAMAQLRSPQGTRLTLHASRVASRKVRAITVLTERSAIEADLLGKTISITPRIDSGQAGEIEAVAVPSDEPLRLELQSFLETILWRGRPVVGIEDGLQALCYADAIGEMIGCPVLPQPTEMVTAGSLLAAGD